MKYVVEKEDRFETFSTYSEMLKAYEEEDFQYTVISDDTSTKKLNLRPDISAYINIKNNKAVLTVYINERSITVPQIFTKCDDVKNKYYYSVTPYRDDLNNYLELVLLLLDSFDGSYRIQFDTNCKTLESLLEYSGSNLYLKRIQSRLKTSNFNIRSNIYGKKVPLFRDMKKDVVAIWEI